MPMYDIVLTDYNLPLPAEISEDFKPIEFQTKDLDNTFTKYKLDKDGQLWYETCTRIYVEGDINAKNPLDRIGQFRSVDTRWEHSSITDTIRIYNNTVIEDSYIDYIIEYKLTFVDGVITLAEIINFETIDTENLKLEQSKFDSDIIKRINFEKTNLYKFLVKPYNSIIKFICNGLYKFSSFLHKNVWKWERKFTI